MWQPDSSALAVTTWFVAIVLALAFAVMGHRVGGRRVSHALARLVGSLVSTAAFVLAAVLTLNAQYGWYESWDDVDAAVTGKAPTIEQHAYGHARTQAEKDAAMARAREVDAAADAKYAVERTRFAAQFHVKPTGTGQWLKITVPGIRMQGKDIGRVMVWLPPSYGREPQRTYPVIEAFHGMPGGTLDFERVFHLDAALRTAETAGSVRDAIIVVPQEMPGGVDTECVDGGGLTMETWLTSTVPDYVIQHLRVQASRESWTTLGVSAGGWCASMAAVLHPGRYAGAVSLGGYFTPQFSGWNPFGANVPARYDLVEQAKKKPAQPQAFWVLVSGADKISGASSEAFVKAASAYDVTQVDLPHAGHRISVWEATFPRVFAWLGKSLPAFSPSAGGAMDSTATVPGSSRAVPGSTVPGPASVASGTARHRTLLLPGVQRGGLAVSQRTRG